MIKNYLLFPLFPKNILSGNKQKVYKKPDRVLINKNLKIYIYIYSVAENF